VKGGRRKICRPRGHSSHGDWPLGAGARRTSTCGKAGTDAKAHIRSPPLIDPAILAAEEQLVELGGADAVSGSNLDAVTGSSHPNHCALMCDDLGVVIVDHEAPIRGVVEPVLSS
jgi:hypothetical protein